MRDDERRDHLDDGVCGEWLVGRGFLPCEVGMTELRREAANNVQQILHVLRDQRVLALPAVESDGGKQVKRQRRVQADGRIVLVVVQHDLVELAVPEQFAAEVHDVRTIAGQRQRIRIAREECRKPWVPRLLRGRRSHVLHCLPSPRPVGRG